MLSIILLLLINYICWMWLFHVVIVVLFPLNSGISRWFWCSRWWAATVANRWVTAVVSAVGQILCWWVSPDASIWTTAGCTWFPATWVVWWWSWGRCFWCGWCRWFLQQAVGNESNHQTESQFRDDQCFDGFNSNDTDEQRQNRLQFQFQQQKSWQQ